MGTPPARASAPQLPLTLAPQVARFRAIRQHFGISALEYSLAFPDNLSALGSNWRERLKAPHACVTASFCPLFGGDPSG